MKTATIPASGVCPYTLMDTDVICCEDCPFYLDLADEEQLLCFHPKVRFQADPA